MGEALTEDEGSVAHKQIELSGSLPSTAYITLIRVHFDGYSPVWDEWYDQSDYARLAPVYSKSARKLKIFDFQIVQRRLSYYLKDPATALTNCTEDGEDVTDTPAVAAASVSEREGENKSRRLNCTSDGCAVGKIELLSEPWLVQLESYRSIEHGFQHIIEQALRFLSPGNYQDKRIVYLNKVLFLFIYRISLNDIDLEIFISVFRRGEEEDTDASSLLERPDEGYREPSLSPPFQNQVRRKNSVITRTMIYFVLLHHTHICAQIVELAEHARASPQRSAGAGVDRATGRGLRHAPRELSACHEAASVHVRRAL